MRKLIILFLCSGMIVAGCRRRRSREAPQTQAEPIAQAVVQQQPLTPAAGEQLPEPAESEIAVGDKGMEPRLLRGFYESRGGWRWSARVFAVKVDVPQPLARTFLELDCGVPGELLDQVHDVTITGRVNHVKVVQATYKKRDRVFLSAEVPMRLLQHSPVEVEFELDKAAKDANNGNREIGLTVVGVSLKHYDESVAGRDSEAERSRNGYLKLLQERRLKIPLEKQQEMMKLFHEVPIWAHMWFQNVQIEKNPLDLWMMQQMIYELRPEFIVETGTAYGGSALFWAYTLNGMGLVNSRVFTVDITDFTKGAAQNPLWTKYVTFNLGSSTDPAIVARIMERIRGHRTIVTLDSDHRMPHVLKELQMYSPMVAKGSYLIVEDTHMDAIPTSPDAGPGPFAAVRTFLAQGGSKDFEPDPTREAFVMTFNPGGWLKHK